ncbi:MAG: hypothetical protein SFV19_16605 [Rhodospirillaceae bacterium]|nr:hypothetical protein [Rhodospirillaceae bacterium]
MHTPDPVAHGLAALALVEALAQKLIAKGALTKAEVADICTAIKGRYDAQGVRHNSAVETDAGLLLADFRAKL